MVDCLGYVDRRPAHVFFMWLFAVAVELGKYFQTASVVSPGHDKDWLLFMALIHMDGGRLKAHWWRNWISFAFDEVWYALWAACLVNLDGRFLVVSRSFVGTIQSPVVGWHFLTGMCSALQKI